MVKIFRKLFFGIIIGFLLVNLGCAGKKIYLENETLRNEKVDLEDGINSLTLQLNDQSLECSKEKELRKNELKNLRTRIDRLYKEKQDAIKQITLQDKNKKLLISLPDNILFNKGSYLINTTMKPFLRILADHIRKYPDRFVFIGGHTCDLPTHSSKYSSNWELSALRAMEVLNYFINDEKLPPQQFSIMGFGEYQPKVLHNSEKERMKNRRVQIIILPEELSQQLIN